MPTAARDHRGAGPFSDMSGRATGATRLPGSVLAVKFAGNATWHERLLLYPVRYDKGKESWIVETPAGAIKEEAVKDWQRILNLKSGYPSDFRAETIQFAEMVEEADLSHRIQIGRLEACRLRKHHRVPEVLHGKWELTPRRR